MTRPRSGGQRSPLQACQGRRLGHLIQQLRDSSQAISGGSRLRFLAADRLGRVFTVLPFGLCTACYLFTKLLRPLVRYWRTQGLRVVVYLDDGLGAEGGSNKTGEASTMVQDMLERAGFVPHPIKCMWKAGPAADMAGICE